MAIQTVTRGHGGSEPPQRAVVVKREVYITTNVPPYGLYVPYLLAISHIDHDDLCRNAKNKTRKISFFVQFIKYIFNEMYPHVIVNTL